MSKPRHSISSVVARIIEVLESSGEIYAFGGAVALAAWSEPRATADVDVVIWVTPESIDRAIDLIIDAGAELDPALAREAAETEGLFIAMMDPIRLDVFVPSIPFYEQAAGRRARVEIGGKATWVHTPEVLAVFKLLFFRPKDMIDIRRMLEIQGSAFDREFVRQAIVEMLGEDDERIPRWDAICREVEPSKTASKL